MNKNTLTQAFNDIGYVDLTEFVRHDLRFTLPRGIKITVDTLLSLRVAEMEGTFLKKIGTELPKDKKGQGANGGIITTNNNMSSNEKTDIVLSSIEESIEYKELKKKNSELQEMYDTIQKEYNHMYEILEQIKYMKKENGDTLESAVYIIRHMDDEEDID